MLPKLAWCARLAFSCLLDAFSGDRFANDVDDLDAVSFFAAPEETFAAEVLFAASRTAVAGSENAAVPAFFFGDPAASAAGARPFSAAEAGLAAAALASAFASALADGALAPVACAFALAAAACVVAATFVVAAFAVVAASATGASVAVASRNCFCMRKAVLIAARRPAE